VQFAPLLLQNSAMFARGNRFHTTFGTSVEEMEGAAAAMIGEAFGVATLGHLFVIVHHFLLFFIISHHFLLFFEQGFACCLTTYRMAGRIYSGEDCC
jgi:hypothetical protein